MPSAWDGLCNSPKVTELPHYAYGLKTKEDAYFTRRDVASYCVEKFESVCDGQNIELADYLFIEPSAGEGCFFDSLPTKAEKIGLDIEPRRPEFESIDYLRWFPKDADRKFVVIGNPPFGHRGAMALAFVKRSFLFADLVAFILPMSFYSNGKGSNMNQVSNATLIFNEKLNRESFYNPENGNIVAVNTVFQVWRKGIHQSVFKEYDVSEFAEVYSCCTIKNRASGLGKNRNYDCFIAATFYGTEIDIVYDFDNVKYGAGYGIVIKKEKKNVLAALRNADWLYHSSDATSTCKHIRKFHIHQVLGEAGFGHCINNLDLDSR